MLTGKNIVITGCNRGIGRAIMVQCMKNGANVWACMRRPSEDMNVFLNEMHDSYPVKIVPVYFDLMNEEEIKKGAAKILQDKVPVDAIINNAGITGVNRLYSMTSMHEIKNVFEVNFFAPMYLTQRLLKNMIHCKKGCIVNIASVAALDGEPAQFGYVASKAALIGATKKLSSELAQFGIRVNALAPGITETDMIQKMDAEVLKREIEHTKLKRLAMPEEIAEMAVFLISEQSSFVTGQVIRVDGGRG